MKFKTTERYSFGWSDPRGIFDSANINVNPPKTVSNDIIKLSVKACRDLYIVRVGDGPVEIEILEKLDFDDPLWSIVQKLLNADELIYEVMNLPDRVGRVEVYKLKAEYGDN